jgi:hypothetical protein
METLELPAPHNCVNCGSDRVTETVQTYPVEHRYRGVPGTYSVTAPVMKCGACGDQWTDWRAEELSEAAFKAAMVEIDSRTRT